MRSITVSKLVTLRGEGWTATGTVTPGTRPTYSRDYGHQPGDPLVVEDITLESGEEPTQRLDEDDLTQAELDLVESYLADAAGDAVADAKADADENRADAARDERRFGREG